MTKKCYIKGKSSIGSRSLKKGLPTKRKEKELKVFDRLRATRMGLITLVYAVSKSLLRLVTLLRAKIKKHSRGIL